MLTHLQISGTHHDIGMALGKFGAQALHRFAKESPAWAELMQYRHSQAVKAMRTLVIEQHPAYWAEIEGLAMGLQMPIEDVFTWNCRGDLWAGAADGCTTIGRPWPELIIAHNEDGDPLFRDNCGLAQIKPDDELGFTAFVYPGSIPGHTFGANAAGLCLTVNNLRNLNATAGMPRMIITRALLTQPLLASALQYLRSTPSSGGFHVTLGQAGEQQLYSVEFNCRQQAIMEVKQTMGHANHMIHPEMAQEPQIITESSKSRQARLQACLAQNPAIEPLEILFDTENATYPIFRASDDDADGENTLATARFEVGVAQLVWQVYQGQSYQPIYRLVNERLAPNP